LLIKHEDIKRKMPSKIHIVNWNRTRTGKHKPIPPKVSLIEPTPAAFGSRESFRHFDTLSDLLYEMAGHSVGKQKIRTPVYAPGYPKK